LPLTGAIDQFVDSADVLSDVRVFRGLAPLHDGWAAAVAKPDRGS
jgi:hypothetical protein